MNIKVMTTAITTLIAAASVAKSGSWKLKYDAGASKKLKEKVSIVDAVKLPSNVKLRVSQKILETL